MNHWNKINYLSLTFFIFNPYLIATLKVFLSWDVQYWFVKSPISDKKNVGGVTVSSNDIKFPSRRPLFQPKEKKQPTNVAAKGMFYLFGFSFFNTRSNLA